MALIALLLPNSRIIHCVRNPIDNCLSIYSNMFSEQHAYANDLGDLAWYYQQYQALMAHWTKLLPGTIHEVRYESLVDNLAGETARVLEFLRLPWDDACLNFQENDRSVSTISRWQVRQPLYRTSVERWRPFEKHLGPLIEAFNAP